MYSLGAIQFLVSEKNMIFPYGSMKKAYGHLGFSIINRQQLFKISTGQFNELLNITFQSARTFLRRTI